MLAQRSDDARRAIIGIAGVGQVLKLATATCWKVAARRALVARPRFQPAIVVDDVAGNRERDMATAAGHTVATRRDADDGFAHRTDGIAATRSSAIICGPAASAARP